MDLFIHTLTGTIFELRVSPFETILSLKAKLQRIEGISISQQHLIWRSMELEDDYCLHDYGIKSGATLTLVLAMRDGPINMRRVSLEEPSLQEMAEYMDENRDDLWDKLISDDKQVTLLVYREGDQLNFFRVYDRGDGTLSPYTDSINDASVSNTHDDDLAVPVNKEKQKENLITKDKMTILRQQIAAKSAKKLPNLMRPPRSPTTVIPSANLSKRRFQFGKQSPRDLYSQNSARKNTASNSDKSVNVQITPSPIKFDPVSSNQHVNLAMLKPLPPVTRKARDTNVDISELIHNPPNDKISHNSLLPNIDKHNSLLHSDQTNNLVTKNSRRPPGLHNNILKPNIEKNDSRKSAHAKRRFLKPIGTVDKNTSNLLIRKMITPPIADDKKETSDCTLPRLPSSVISDESYSDMHLDDTLKSSQLPELLRDPVEYENYKNLLDWVHPKSNEHGEKVAMKSSEAYGHKACNEVTRKSSRGRNKTPDGRSSSRLRSTKVHVQGNLTHLPSVHNDKRSLPTLTGKKKPRCTICTKKLGLATTYQCRCGYKFCAKHRYPETHTCTYDYKSEGRRILQRSNPVVTAPKLPKI